MTLPPGQTIGRYQIIEPLGVGGMATVYKAFQPSLEREVALKVLRPGFAEDPEFFQRFQREARSIARLRHPNIVQVFDFEPLDGRYVLAMEFLEGGTLKERVTALAAKGERLSHAEVSRIVGEVASALSYGHELGIVHRDVKPSNVMLAQRDRAVVTDFGIAKIMGGEGQTQTGVGIGTPEYMAPEQGSGAGVDHRADIYSLGVMAYEMLTGRVPFIADTPLAIVMAHMRDPLPLPRTLEPSIPVAAEHALMKALAKAPNDRYASATDFADSLRVALVPVTPTAATMYPITPLPGTSAGTTRSVPRNLIIGAAAVALLVIGGVGYALTRDPGSTTAGRPNPDPVASSGPTAPTVAVAARGALTFEAKFDEAGTAIKFAGPPGSTAPPGLRTLNGSVELSPGGAQDAPLVFGWGRPFLAPFFAELDFKSSPGSNFQFAWEVWRTPQAQSIQARIGLGGTALEDTLAFQYNLNQPGQALAPETIGSAIRVPGLWSGEKVTLGLAVQPQGVFALYLNGQKVGEVTDARAVTGDHQLSVDVHGGTGTLTVTGFRVYQLIAP